MKKETPITDNALHGVWYRGSHGSIVTFLLVGENMITNVEFAKITGDINKSVMMIVNITEIVEIVEETMETTETAEETAIETAEETAEETAKETAEETMWR